MTRDEAHAYRTARGNEYRHLRRNDKHVLVALYHNECGGLGGGTWSKDDLIGAVLERRYPLARENEAIHVLYHTDVIWDGCELCASDYPPEYVPDDGEAQRIAEVYADAKAELDRGL